MIVRLTRNQLEELNAVGTELHQEWLVRTFQSISKQMVEVSMPPIGWKTLSELVAAQAFTAYGNRWNGRMTLQSALRRVSKVLAKVEAHPAFKGLAMPGRHYERFMAWNDGPYPSPNVAWPAVDLVPRHIHTSDGFVMTQWQRRLSDNTVARLQSRGLVDQLPLFVPAEHELFIRRPASPDASPSP